MRFKDLTPGSIFVFRHPDRPFFIFKKISTGCGGDSPSDRIVVMVRNFRAQPLTFCRLGMWPEIESSFMDSIEELEVILLPAKDPQGKGYFG